jgi:beta-mannosidase
MDMYLRLMLYLICLWPSAFIFAQKPSRNLSKENWQFSIGASKITFKAKVPGCQYTDMLQNKLIAHPFMGNNEAQHQDIAKFPITYHCTFHVGKNELQNPKIYLLFKGLDTYAKVYLNGQFILNANNMHRSWECEVKSLLKLGLNSLKIRFEPIADITKNAASSAAYTLPGGEYVWVRKAAYQFGWDWAPRFLTAGIWKDIELVFKGANQLKSFQFKVLNLHDTLAQLSYQVQLDKPASKGLKLSLSLENSAIKRSILIDSGQTTATLLFNIPKPKLWWCNGMGAPYLYQAQLQLFEHNQLLDQANTQFGIRTIEWVQHPDDSGSSFYLKLNGFPIFMKGANWVPLHSFLPEIKPEQYAYHLKLAANANLNMLRVWGGGIYESDAFYEQCDANGILVWQDFMFACAMYPGDTNFLTNVSKEADIIGKSKCPTLQIEMSEIKKSRANRLFYFR